MPTTSWPDSRAAHVERPGLRSGRAVQVHIGDGLGRLTDLDDSMQMRCEEARQPRVA